MSVCALGATNTFHFFCGGINAVADFERPATEAVTSTMRAPSGTPTSCWIVPKSDVGFSGNSVIAPAAFTRNETVSVATVATTETSIARSTAPSWRMKHIVGVTVMFWTSGRIAAAAGSFSNVTASYSTHEPSTAVRTISFTPFFNSAAGSATSTFCGLPACGLESEASPPPGGKWNRPSLPPIATFNAGVAAA